LSLAQTLDNLEATNASNNRAIKRKEIWEMLWSLGIPDTPKRRLYLSVGLRNIPVNFEERESGEQTIITDLSLYYFGLVGSSGGVLLFYEREIG